LTTWGWGVVGVVDIVEAVVEGPVGLEPALVCRLPQELHIQLRLVLAVLELLMTQQKVVLVAIQCLAQSHLPVAVEAEPTTQLTEMAQMAVVVVVE